MMSIKRNYIVGDVDGEKIKEVTGIVEKYADITMESSSHMFFDKQPIDPNHYKIDVIFFQIEAENEIALNKELNEMIEKLKLLNADLMLRDVQAGKFLINIQHGGILTIKFDNIKTIKEETYKKIDRVKLLKTEYGYCRGFKPSFRPIEPNSIENIYVSPETIYLISDSSEHLSQLKDEIFKEILKIDPDFTLEFNVYC